MGERSKKKKAFFDDGRVIAPMGDVQRSQLFRILPRRVLDKRREREKAVDAQNYLLVNEKEPLSKREARIASRAMMLAYLAALLLVLGAFALVLLLCQFVWFQ